MNKKQELRKMAARARQYGRGTGRYPENRAQIEFLVRLQGRRNKNIIEFKIMAINEFEANAKALNQLIEQNLVIDDYDSLTVNQIDLG